MPTSAPRTAGVPTSKYFSGFFIRYLLVKYTLHGLNNGVLRSLCRKHGSSPFSFPLPASGSRSAASPAPPSVPRGMGPAAQVDEYSAPEGLDHSGAAIRVFPSPPPAAGSCADISSGRTRKIDSPPGVRSSRAIEAAGARTLKSPASMSQPSASPHQRRVDEIHRRRADEAGDEAVRRLRVDVQRRRRSAGARRRASRRCGRPWSWPPPGRG